MIKEINALEYSNEIKAHEWLDKWYPVDGCSIDLRRRHPNYTNLNELTSNYGKKRDEIVSLDLSTLSTYSYVEKKMIVSLESVKLSGDLDFSNFTNLKRLNVNGNQLRTLKVPASLEVLFCSNNSLDSLNISHCSELGFLFCNNNQITNLDLRNNLGLLWLHCNVNKLINLDLSQNRQLERLDCALNQLKEIILSNEQKLEVIKLNDNLFTSFPYEIIDKESLTELALSNNNLELTNINVFQNFKNLRKLWIGSWDVSKIENEIYNRFHGSFESFKGLKLDLLAVDNTDIDHGSQYLPASIKTWGFVVSERQKCKLAELEQINLYYLNKNYSWNYHECFNFRIEEELLKSEKTPKEKLEKQLYAELNKLVEVEEKLWKKEFNLSEKDLENIVNWKKLFTNNFTAENFNEVKEWLTLGFRFEEFSLVRDWKENMHFDFARYFLSGMSVGKDQCKVIVYWCKLCDKESYKFRLNDWCLISKWGIVADNWMDTFYLKDKRDKVEILDISNQFLSGELDLTSFTNLKWIDCSNNKISKLIINSNLNLNCFNYGGNKNIEIVYSDNKSSYFSRLTKKVFNKLERFNLNFKINETQCLLIEK